IFVESSEQEERVLGLDADLLDFDFVVGHDAVARQEAVHVRRGFLFESEKGIAEFLLEVAMEVEFCPAWVDHDLASIVVEKEGHVHALGGYFDPLAASALAFPLPDNGAVVIAGALGDGCEKRVWSNGEAAEFDHAHGCAANLGNGRVENQLPALQDAEAVKENIDTGAETDDAPDDRAYVLRAEKEGRENRFA